MKSFLKRILARLLYDIQFSDEYKSLIKKHYSFKYLGVNSEIPAQSSIKNPHYISIGNNFQSMYNLRLEAWDSYFDDRFTPELTIGNNVSMNTDVHIGCINKIVISDNVMIASRVYISDHSHGETTIQDLNIAANKRKLISKGPIVIEENVWIGEGVCILPGVTIGKNSIIGANAVVNKSFLANSIIGGVPAKLIKTIS